MDLSSVGVVPKRTADPLEALSLVRSDGAAIFTGLGLDGEEGRKASYAVFGDDVLAVPSAARVFIGGEQDRIPEGHSNATRSHTHTDGYSYGEKYPDYILLLCARHCEAGGESFLVDGYALLDLIGDDPEYGWLPDALSTVQVNQTEPGMQLSMGTIVKMNPEGRKMLLMAGDQDQRPMDDSANPERDSEMIKTWRRLVESAADIIPRFKLLSGEAFIIDNYRLFHGRDPYEDMNRLMWRVWIWTRECAYGLPEGVLHSDSRYARAI